jgi:uncharacterized protein (DUF427 family)
MVQGWNLRGVVAVARDVSTEQRGRVRTEPTAKRIRAQVDGVAVADTTHGVLVWENPAFPAYYLPAADVRMDLLHPSGSTSHSPSRGDATVYSIRVNDDERVDAAWQYPTSPIEELRDLVRFDWNSIDAWFEEDEEVFVHPRSPYTRIDILESSRPVRIEIDGTVLADSDHAHVLFETGLPARWYVPKVDVRMDLLDHTDSSSQCPYKGTAEYWSARVGDRTAADVAWSYRTPLPESEKVAGMICFYNERVDLYVDGVLEARPETKFS